MTDTKSSSQNEPEMKGWLFKWTNYLKGYQRRWFVLQNGTLSYYRSVCQIFDFAFSLFYYTWSDRRCTAVAGFGRSDAGAAVQFRTFHPSSLSTRTLFRWQGVCFGGFYNTLKFLGRRIQSFFVGVLKFVFGK